MSPPAVNPSMVRSQLSSLLSGPTFVDAERHRRLLEFLVDATLKGEAEGLKEFVIAAEVWGRSVSFDPRILSTVRSEVSRLRARLERYYSNEGKSDSLRFSIPVGSYRVSFESMGQATAVAGANHFEILELLGRGGMGEIWKARDTRLGRDVALKFISEALAQDRTTVARFEREARAAAAINHHNICTVYDVGELDGRPFLAMELLEGATLKQRLEGKQVPLELLLDWAIQIADGLDAAHAGGIVHRDLKPANLFVTSRSQVKLLDFGLAMLRGDAAHPTLSGVAGTPVYMSPEQARGEKLDSRTDLFSLGVILYELATGSVPVRLAEPASRRNAQVPAELDRIIAKALEEDRDLRYQHASELRGDLKRLKRDSDSKQAASSAANSSPQQTPQAGPRRKLVMGAAALAVVATVAFWFARLSPTLRAAKEAAPPQLSQGRIIGTFQVPGRSNPYLAGRPNGTTCCKGVDRFDQAPLESPVQVTGFTPCKTLTFSATGGTNYDNGVAGLYPPDGFGTIKTGPTLGIAEYTGPVSALVGVFLGGNPPSPLSQAPPGVDFTTSGWGTNFLSFPAQLGQVFFIGDGLSTTSTGPVIQSFVIPCDATALYLGTADGVGWWNNAGELTVRVREQ